MSYPEWQHRVTLDAAYPGGAYGPKARITAEAGLHYIEGNSEPYFSLTGSIYIPGRRDVEACGLLTREILSVWPELAPIAELHLSGASGAPMHAEANGWYWLAGFLGGAGERYHGGNGDRQHWLDDGTFDGYRHSTPDECLATFAKHARVSIDAIRPIAERWRDSGDWPAVREGYRNWMREQHDRWAQQVADGIALLDRLASGGSDAH